MTFQPKSCIVFYVRLAECGRMISWSIITSRSLAGLFLGLRLQDVSVVDNKCQQWWLHLGKASFREHWRGSLWINVFKRSSSNPEGLPERGVSLMTKRSSLKRENHFLAVLSPMTLCPYMAQMFLPASAAFAPLLNSKRRICRKCSNFSTCYSIF